MANRYGLAFKVPKRKKTFFEWHPDAFARNLSASTLKALGYKVRKLKPKVI